MGDNSPPLNAQIPIHNNLRMKKSLDDFSIAYVEEFDPREVLNEEGKQTFSNQSHHQFNLFH